MCEIIMWVLAIYGILKLIQDIFELSEVRKVINGNMQIILRVFNQQEKIFDIVKKILLEFPESSVKVEDAGSYDNTYNILLELEKEHKNLHVIRM